MSLVRAERRRFAKRRLTKWLVAAGVLLLAVVVAGVFFDNNRITPQVRAQAQADATANFEAASKDFAAGKERCAGAPTTDERCGYYLSGQPPSEPDFLAEHYLPSSFDFKKETPSLMMVWAAIIAMIAFVLGASFIGAEWASGSMMNLLTWRPKRTGVLAVKLGVLLGGLTTIALVTGGLWVGALWLTGYLRGSNAGMTQGAWQSLGLTGLRGLGLILVFGAIGFLLASIGRHTGLALGAALAVIIVGQVGVAIVLNLMKVPFYDQYLIPTHLSAWIYKQTELEQWPQICNMMCEPEKMIVSWGESGSIAAGLIVVLLVVAFWQLRRRDVA